MAPVEHRRLSVNPSNTALAITERYNEFVDVLTRWGITDIVPFISPASGITILRGSKSSQTGFFKVTFDEDELCVLQLRSEWNILSEMASAHVPSISKAIMWVSFEHVSGMFLEDLGYRTMREMYLSTDITPASESDFNWLAFMKRIRHVCRALNGCHALNIRHCNIRPDSIAIAPDLSLDDPRSVVVGSWFFASRLAVENAGSTSAVLEASLSYVAPECTGRMNRSVDLRADLYSLGVTLYEVISGECPFEGSSNLEIIHKHISKTPEPLSTYGPIPKSIELLIGKLLMKNLDDRYQSAMGILHDVDKIIHFLEDPTSSAQAKFVIGLNDHASKFVVSSDFVGRETEVQSLIQQYHGLVADSRTRVATIAGYSGVGKSRLVQEVLHTISQSQIRVFYAECKFDQYKSFAPFAILSTLVRDLLAQVFVEPAHVLATWRERIQRALGSEALSVCELCPDVVALLTPAYLEQLPPLVPLGAMASEERLKRCLKRLIQCFAARQRQLVIFVDDIQWAPPVDLSILLSIREQTDLFLLCAYRDNEVGKDHIVNTIFLNNIASDVVLTLQALSHEDATKIIAATLHRELSLLDRDSDHGRDLGAFVDLIYVKTQGNAFFITQMLSTLYNSQLLQFDFARGYWTWDLETIRAVEMPEDVIGLVLRQLADLTPACREVLQVASCLGNSSFRLDMLEITTLKPRAALAQDLFGAMSSGLVLPVDDSYKAALALGTPEEWIKTSEAGPEPRAGERTSRLSSSVRADKTFGDTLVVGYRFLHDKVQQAVYALIDERDRPSIQLQTGSRLLEAFGDDVRDSMLFDICSQINKGRSLLPRREYLRLAKLNLRAAQTAFQNTASETALQFLCQTRDYFPENIWHIDAPMVEQYYELTENVYASMTLYEEAIKASTTIFENSTNLVVKTRMHGRQVKAYMSLGRAAEAIATGCAGLTAAGIPFEKYLDGSLSDSDIDDAVISLWAALPSSATAIHSLNTLPIIEDELMLAGSEILMIFLPPLYLSNPALAPLLVLTGVMTSIKKGIASYTCYFMYFLAMLLCEIDDPHCDFELAAAWNQTSEVLLDELMRSSPRYLEHAGSSLTLSGCVYAFTRDARVESLRAFNLSIELSQRCFDGQYMAYSVGNQANTRLFCGENLMQILNELVKHVNLVRSYKQTPGMLYCLPTLQVIHNLVHSSNRQKALEMSGTLVADLTKSLELLETGDSLLLHSVYFWTARLLLCLVLQDHEGAILAVLGGRKMLHGAYGVATKLYFETMALVVLLEHKDRGLKMPPELADYLPILCNHIEGWAKQNSRNYGCWKFFMLAETKKSAQGLEATLNAYERAIEAAVESKNYLLEAIFNERCAKYLKNSGLGQKIAAGYIEAAIQAYQSWGSPVSASHCASVYGASDLHRSETDSNVSSFEARLRTSSYGNVSRNIAGHVSVTSMMSDLSSPSPSADSTGSTAMMSRLMSIQEDYSTETDLSVVIQSSLLLTRTLGTAELVKQLLKLLVQVAGAQHGALVIDLQQDQNLCVAATTELAGVQLYDDLPLDAAGDLVPIQLIRLAANSRRCIIDEARFVRQPYQRSGKQEHSLGAAKSFMALPVLLRDKILAVAYLSNNQISNLFTSRKVELLTILASQAAITLEKSKIYNDLRLVNDDLILSKQNLEHQKEELEAVVRIRTAQLQTQNDALYGEIQQRKIMEKELIAAKDTAEKATAMKSRFLAMMSHEMRTPFNAVIGFSTLLLDTSLTAEQQDMAQSIVDSSTDLIAIINDILDFSKIENDKMNLDPIWFDLRSLIESTLELISRPATNKDIALAFLEDATEAANWIFADNSRMRQCVLNLLSNAVKFTSEHGSVSVRTKLELLDSQAGEDQKGLLSVIVNDTGIGIAKQDQKKLFHFFSQVDDSVTRRFGGTGLGLAISYKICHLFGGDLVCESEEGRGSTFTATFVVHINRKTHPTEQLHSAVLKDKTCLILEPSKLLSQNLQQHLNIFGIKHFTRSSLVDVSAATDKCDFAIIGDHFNQPETILSLRQRGVYTQRLPIVVLMPFGATMPQQVGKKDLQSIDAVVSSPVRRLRLFRSLESLYPEETGVSTFAKPTSKNLKTITNPEESFPRKDLSILLVEDNLINVKVAMQLLKRAGYVPKVAHDGIEAVTACVTEHFDLIFMDLSMPRMGGLQATLGIRAQQIGDQRPYICAMTANAMSGDREKCLEADMDDYITKPVLKPQLQAVLDKVRDMVVGTIRGHENIERIDHENQVNLEELSENFNVRRRSIQEQFTETTFAGRAIGEVRYP